MTGETTAAKQPLAAAVTQTSNNSEGSEQDAAATRAATTDSPSCCDHDHDQDQDQDQDHETDHSQDHSQEEQETSTSEDKGGASSNKRKAAADALDSETLSMRTCIMQTDTKDTRPRLKLDTSGHLHLINVPFLCQECHYESTSFRDMSAHCRQHEHVFRCMICAKNLSRTDNTTIHLFSHLQVTPFECTQDGCHRRYSHYFSLRRHQKLSQHKGLICHEVEVPIPSLASDVARNTAVNPTSVTANSNSIPDPMASLSAFGSQAQPPAKRTKPADALAAIHSPNTAAQAASPASVGAPFGAPSPNSHPMHDLAMLMAAAKSGITPANLQLLQQQQQQQQAALQMAMRQANVYSMPLMAGAVTPTSTSVPAMFNPANWMNMATHSQAPVTPMQQQQQHPTANMMLSQASPMMSMPPNFKFPAFATAAAMQSMNAGAPAARIFACQ